MSSSTLSFAHGNTRQSPDRAAALISANRSFSNNGKSFTGEPGAPWSTGYMSPENQDLLTGYKSSVGIDYVIRSYGTPIAYRLKTGQWVVPVASYSVTTGRHQAHVWSILRSLGVNTSWSWVPDISTKTGKPLKSRSHREQTVFTAATV